jgi:hypothetical protein
VRERGVQSRRVRPGPVAPTRRPGPPSGPSNSNFWQILAIIALVAATAGWTTVAVLALRPASPEALAPVESFDPNASDDSEVPPVADTHDAPAMEALLPTTVSGSALQVQSWNGDGLLADDPWSTAMSAFLSASCKTSADLHLAQSYDPNEALDISIGVYTVDGVSAAAVRGALIEAFKGDSPDMKVSQVTLGGKDITKGDFGPDLPTSYLWVHDDAVYDIESSDETIATAALAALPTAAAASGAPVASGSSAPAASCVPASASPGAADSPSPS